MLLLSYWLGGERLKDRILKIRKDYKLTQDAFAEKLKLSKNFVWMLEKGDRIPSDRTISDMCREFNVNEDWLRTGEGVMYRESIEDDELTNTISNLLEDIHCDDSVYTLVKEFLIRYDRLDPQSKKIISQYVDDGIHGYIKKREEL